MIVWLPILWVAAGICLFAGVHFLNARHSQETAWLYPAFGALCVLVAAYIALSAVLQMPSGITSWIRVERLHVAVSCLIFPTAMWFMALYSRMRTWHAWVIGGTAVFGALLLVDATGSQGLLVADYRLGAPLVLPWGEHVNTFTSTSARFAPAYYLATLAVFCWAFWRCAALWRQGDTRRAWPLATYLVLQAGASTWSDYATMRALPGLDWDALPFLALVVLLSRTLTQELRHYDMALRESNAALLKENAHRAQVEDRLRHMAYHDVTSKLPNRNALNDWLARLLAERPPPAGVLVVVDPERFGLINSALGHQVGDLLITEIGKRLSAAAGPTGYVARLNGDEFAVVLLLARTTAMSADDQIQARAKALRDALAAPSQLADQALSISVHMGLAPLAGETGEELLRQAYAALHVAKREGHQDTVVYADPMQADAERKLRLEADLRTAIENDALQLVYQTQVDRTGALVGAEALLRWNHPELAAVSPAEFVRVAEKSGQMSALGVWILRNAFATLAALPGAEGFRLSVNISPWQLFLADFLDTVRAAIADSAVDPNRVTLEITETAFIHDIRDASAKIRALDVMGIRVSIDDFGTGYASIASLKAFPVRELKIDQSFIRDMCTDQPDRFVAAMIALGRALDLHVVAEGVEHDDQREALLRMGCDAFQGYLVGRPVAAAELARQLRQLPTRATAS